MSTDSRRSTTACDVTFRNSRRRHRSSCDAWKSLPEQKLRWTSAQAHGSHSQTRQQARHRVVAAGCFASCSATPARRTARPYFTKARKRLSAALENSFRYYCGVPKTLVIDNLKAAVKQADWYDPEIHPKLQSFAQHYGTVFLPTKPYTPEHKGKVEAGVKYVKNNGLKGHEFTSLDAENNHLLEWEDRVADTRLHGTTKRQVRQHFEEIERPGAARVTRRTLSLLS